MHPHAPPGYRGTWAEVDLDCIASNYATIRSLAGRDTAVFPVVKANAYGHGATAVARRLEAEGAATLCVAMPEEGLELRRAGITASILCLGAVDPPQIAPAARSRISLSMYGPDQLEIFESVGRASGNPVHFHLKLDTGMNRLGLLPDEIGPFIEKLRGCRSALLGGVFSNLASADRPDDPASAAQGERLTAAAAAIRAAGFDPRPVHVANSAGLLYHPALRFDAVRPGILIYGVRPGAGDAGHGIVPSLSLKSTVLRVKTVPPGTAVGYSGAWVSTRESRLATLGIGYDDGLPRSITGKGEVLLGGRRAPLVGVVSMDLVVADATDCGEVAPGDEAVLVGSQGGETIGLREFAERAGTIPWEILCGIGRRVPRVHLAGGAVVSVSSVLPQARDLAPVESTKKVPRPRRPAAGPEGSAPEAAPPPGAEPE